MSLAAASPMTSFPSSQTFQHANQDTRIRRIPMLCPQVEPKCRNLLWKLPTCKCKTACHITNNEKPWGFEDKRINMTWRQERTCCRQVPRMWDFWVSSIQVFPSCETKFTQCKLSHVVPVCVIPCRCRCWPLWLASSHSLVFWPCNPSRASPCPHKAPERSKIVLQFLAGSADNASFSLRMQTLV